MPLVNNVDAALTTEGVVARDALLRQIAAPVRWTESVRRILDQGVRTFIEVGPGRVLIGLVKAIAKDAGTEITIIHVEDEHGLEAAMKPAGR